MKYQMSRLWDVNNTNVSQVLLPHGQHRRTINPTESCFWEPGGKGRSNLMKPAGPTCSGDARDFDDTWLVWAFTLLIIFSPLPPFLFRSLPLLPSSPRLSPYNLSTT